MNKQVKPMLASQIDDLSLINYPVMASYKFDGIRALIINGVALSRSLKLIPNKHIQQWVRANKEVLEGLDGEFIVGKPNAEDTFRNTTSFVMSFDKVGDFSYYAFDIISDETADLRFETLELMLDFPPEVEVVDQVFIRSPEELETFRQQALSSGYEGAMVKKPEGLYKYGRSSVKEGLLLKMKLFTDSEFEIVGYEPKYHNANEVKTNELGRTARSSKKEGLVVMDTLGALVLKAPNGLVFGCGSGFDEKTRDELWSQRESLIGKLAKVKYFEVGMLEGIPRFPIYLGLRDYMDIGE